MYLRQPCSQKQGCTTASIISLRCFKEIQLMALTLLHSQLIVENIQHKSTKTLSYNIGMQGVHEFFL